MPKIGLIDDKKAQRESTQRIIKNYINDNYPEWDCIDIYPYQEKSDYVSWIGENDIAIIILDEQLTGEVSELGWNVDYDGHNLIEFIRMTYPTFPVFAMTAYGAKTPELMDNYNLFEDILEDKDFYTKPEQNIDRFIRSGQRFSETNRRELQIISEVSRILAEGGEVSPENLSKAKAIQERLGLPFTIDNIKNRSEGVDLLEKNLNDFETVIEEIQDFLKDELEKNS